MYECMWATERRNNGDKQANENSAGAYVRMRVKALVVLLQGSGECVWRVDTFAKLD